MAEDAEHEEWTYEDPEQEDIVFSIVRPTDVESVAEFLLENFFTNEPLGRALSLDANEEVRPWLADMVAHAIQEKMSILIRQKSVEHGENIVAVCLNDVERIDEDADNVTIFSFVQPEKHPCMWKITRVLEELVRDRDLFKEYKVQNFVGIQMLSVGPQFGGRGLAKKLIELTEMLARLRGFSLMLSEATSEFSARAFLKAGFESKNILQYDSFTLDNEKPFKGLAEKKVHTCAQLMVKALD